MVQKAVPLTREGLAKLERELEYLRTVRRQEVAQRIHQAKELASTQNNAEYDDAKNEQAFVEGRILTLEKMIQNAVIIQEHHSTRVERRSSIMTAFWIIFWRVRMRPSTKACSFLASSYSALFWALVSSFASWIRRAI